MSTATKVAVEVLPTVPRLSVATARMRYVPSVGSGAVHVTAQLPAELDEAPIVVLLPAQPPAPLSVQ